MSAEKKNDRPGPSSSASGWLLALGFLALLGLSDTIYLSVLHWQVHNLPGHVSFCAVNEEVNCDTVALSAYSQVAGVPVSTMGGLVYLGLLVLVVWGLLARRSSFPFGLASSVCGMACAAAAFLFLVSELNIQSFCIMCMVLYGVNLLAALVCVLGGRKVGLPPSSLASLPLLGLLMGTVAFALESSDRLATGWPGLVALGGGAAVGLVLLNLREAGNRWAAWAAALRAELGVLFASRGRGIGLSAAALVLLGGTVGLTWSIYPAPRTEIAGGVADLASGRTPEGHAWIGAEHPEVTIVEYSDYECPFCGRAHESIRHIVRENKDWLRLVHVHMPLDQTCNPMLKRPFHRHSCACARAAECAGEQDAFWQMNDRLFLRRGGLDDGGLVVLAENMGLDAVAFRSCMESERSAGAIAANLAECRRLRLRPATPTFRLGGRVITGLKPPDWWRKMALRVRKARRPAHAPSPGAPNGGGAHGGPQDPGDR